MDTSDGTVRLGPVTTSAAPRPEGAERAVRTASPESAEGTALQHCLLLSLGHAAEITTNRWQAAYERTLTERCAALAWLRSESWIRTSAPPAVVAQWEAWIAAHKMRVERQLDAVAEIEQWLHAHSIPVIVVKGIPLASRLYGSWWARTVNDIDLFVPATQCGPAAEVLRATGWRHLRGTPPLDVEMVKQFDDAIIMAELHGSLAGTWFAGHPFPEPEQESVTIRGRQLRAQSGAFLPTYLASHLLQHSERPLLWILDFRTLWSGMLEEERVAARAAATATRLGGVLALAERWAGVVDAIERGGDHRLLAVLDREILHPSGTAAFAQLMQSAEGAVDAGRMVLQLVWPRELRSDPGRFAGIWKNRLVRRLPFLAAQTERHDRR